MYVKVTVTSEAGAEASDATLLPVEEASGQIEILAATATKANEIEVTLAEAVDADDTVITLSKGTDEFAFTFKWSDTNDSVTLTTAAKLPGGTYTVALASVEDETNTDSAEFEVEKQEVSSIVILNENDIAYTNADPDTKIAHRKAFAYYDVRDQYDQSMRASSSITWAGSCEIKADKSTGQLELTKSDNSAWVYGDKIYITGVNSKTGEAVSKELTVGTEQSLDTIDVVGFVKKGTSTIIEAEKGLPAGFKTGEYYMIFNALDQSKNPYKAEDVTEKDVTFVSSNPMVIKELTKFKKNGLTIEGTLYCAVEVEPGIKVADGGDVTVSAIANKTGNKDDITFKVKTDRVVDSFVLLTPSKTVADGDQGVEIEFEATDEYGEPITDFRTIAKQPTFNTVTFSASEGHLILKEGDDGEAKLVWNDEDIEWKDSRTTDGIDRPVVLTVIVVGGQSSNTRMDVQDKRRPDAIAAVNMDTVYVEGAAITFTNTDTFMFYDQYSALMGDYGEDNGFFAADAAGKLQGVGFADYDFGVRLKNAGSGKITVNGGDYTASNTDTKEYVLKSGKSVEFATATDIPSAATGEGFKFEVAKLDTTEYKKAEEQGDAANWEAVSSSNYVGVTVVDVKQVKNLTVGSLNTFYVGGLDVTGDKMIASGSLKDLKDTPLTVTPDGTAGIYASGDYDQAVVVKGTYNGTTVTIPNNYYTIASNKMSSTAVAGAGVPVTVDRTFDAVIPYSAENEKGLQAADVYDKTTAKGVAKLADDEVTATVYSIYDDAETAYWKWDTDSLAFKQVSAKEITKAEANATLGKDNATLANSALLKKAQRETIQAIDPNADVATDAKLDEYLTGAMPAPTGASLDAAEEAAEAAATALKEAEAAQTLAAAKLTSTERKAANAAETGLADNADDAAIVTALVAQEPWATIKTNVNTYLTKRVATAAAYTAMGDKATIAGEVLVAEADTLYTDAELLALEDATAAASIGEAVAADTDIADGDRDKATNYLVAKRTYLKAQAAETTAGDALSDDVKDLADDEDVAGTEDAAAINALTTTVMTAATTDSVAYIKAIKAVKTATTAKTNADNNLKDWQKKEAMTQAQELEATGVMVEFNGSWMTVSAAFTEAERINNNGGADMNPVYDTAKADITLSDQAPYAYTISGLDESYTFKPERTKFSNTKLTTKLADVAVLDQYGVTFATDVTYTVKDVVENPDGYASNNFKVTGNGTTETSIEGAELGDTFTLEVAYGTLKDSASVVIGADAEANITDRDNNFLDKLVNGVGGLEEQRLAGLA